MDGLLTEVLVSTQGSAATAAVASGTTVPVENLTPFASDGGKVDIAGTVYDYTGVDESTVDADGVGGAIMLASPGLTAPVDEFDPVLLVVGDSPAVDYYAVVDLIDDEDGEPVWVPLDSREERLAWPVRTYDPPLPVSLAPDQSAILQAPGVVPILDGSQVDASTLDTSTMPPPPLTDGLAPDNAPTVTPIGGIGSMFFRWTEITNADPVTYRLHVRAGSDPTTDGTYEVAAGVGLTSASVRKLKDGTAIVGDGSVTYHAIVTVEDADGPGPASVAVTGVPAQVTGPDIAVGAVTTDDLIFNAGWGVELNGETITGALIRTSASGKRVELAVSDDLIAFYSGNADEFSPGYMAAGIAGAGGYVSMQAPAMSSLLTSPPFLELLCEVDSQARLWAEDRIVLEAPQVTVDGGTLDASMGDGSVGTGTFRDSVDARASAVAPTVTMTTGSVGTGAFRDSVRESIEGDYAGGAWASWTPTWAAATTNPALGNGTLVGRYMQLGKTVHFYIEMTAGSTTTFGTGLWSFDLPVAEVTRRFTANGHALDTSSNDQYPILAIRAAADTLNVRCDPTTAGGALRGVAVGQPFTWANGDVLHISGTYEAA